MSPSLISLTVSVDVKRHTYPHMRGPVWKWLKESAPHWGSCPSAEPDTEWSHRNRRLTDSGCRNCPAATRWVHAGCVNECRPCHLQFSVHVVITLAQQCRFQLLTAGCTYTLTLYAMRLRVMCVCVIVYVCGCVIVFQVCVSVCIHDSVCVCVCVC